NAGKLIIPVCLVIGTLNSVTTDFKLKTQGSADTLLASFGKTLTPWFAPMGIEQENWPATVGLFTGIMAKEVVIGSLNTLYTQSSEELTKPLNIKEEIFNALLTIPQNFGELFGFVVEDHTMDKQIYGEMQTRFKGEIGAFAYLLFVLLYFPCVSATAAMIKEVDKKWTLFSLTWTTLIAYAVSVSFFQLATFAQHPLTSTVWTLCMLGIIVVFILLLSNYKMQRTLPTPIILVT
ncbi:MAG TPA: nucleoside recognition domain-containing protein, partial [Gammaproteobacteria bacterium]|nr:nucleoside recognition domain-containing protein [Gammaproteobacteria bacterium]